MDTHDDEADDLIRLTAEGRKMFDAINRLCPEDRETILELATQLHDQGLIIGGPMDGGRLRYQKQAAPIDAFWEGYQHSWDHGATELAVYEVDDRGRLVFKGFEKKDHAYSNGDYAPSVVYIA